MYQLNKLQTERRDKGSLTHGGGTTIHRHKTRREADIQRGTLETHNSQTPRTHNSQTPRTRNSQTPETHHLTIYTRQHRVPLPVADGRD